MKHVAATNDVLTLYRLKVSYNVNLKYCFSNVYNDIKIIISTYLSKVRQSSMFHFVCWGIGVR